MTQTLITAYEGKGLAAARPASLTLDPGAFGLYWATDTNTLSLWDGSAWQAGVGGYNPGTPPTIVQSGVFAGTAAGLTLSGAPANGNYLVAMTFNPSTGSPGSGWTAQGGNSSGTDFGQVFTKVAGGAESATQNPLASSVAGAIMMWELHGQASVGPLLSSASMVEGAGLIALGPSVPNLKNAIALGAMSLVSASNNISTMSNMTQDQIINTGTVRQIVGGHSNLLIAPNGQMLVSFTGAGSPGFKGAIALVTA